MWERKYIHPVSSSPIYRKLYGIRLKMIERCTDPSCDRYKDYGGRGITVCQEWQDDFDNFVEWALNNGYAEGLTIDRIDNDGNYEPENCRWATRREQNRNRRNTIMAEYRGEVKPLRTWCEELNLKYDTMHNRITHGWDVKEAFETPSQNEKESFSAMCRRYGARPGLVRDRIVRFGWSLEDALTTPSAGRGGHRKANCGEGVCAVCGKTYTRKNGKQKYCSPECHAKSKRVWFKKIQAVEAAG